MRAAVLALAVVAAACGDDGPGVALFPDDYASTYQEVRDCRRSGGAHDINHVRVLAAPDTVAIYNDRSGPFPEGAIVLKEEYDFSDSTCAGPIVQWSVMQKRASGTSTDTLDWTWQRVDRLGNVASEDDSRCIGCHEDCGVAPDGHDGTCTVP